MKSVKKWIILGLSMAKLLSSPAQITIETCYQKAQENYPLIKKYGLIEKTKNFNISNAEKGYLPQVAISGNASYQSDVTHLPSGLSNLALLDGGIPTMSKDHYGITVDVNQTIWDGGRIKAQKEIAQMQGNVEKGNTEVGLYAINQRINGVFFGILLADAELKQSQLYLENLERNFQKINSYHQNGLANQGDVDAVEVNILKAKQTRIQYETTRKTYLEMLSQLIGEELNDSVKLEMPNGNQLATAQINRPELKWFDAQINYYKALHKETISDLLPKLGAYMTGGYGRPALNMLEDKFKPYYIAGIKLSWNLGALYTHKNREQIIENNIKTVEVDRETFLFNTQLDMHLKNNEIAKYIQQLKFDDHIIRLRKSIEQISEGKIANGTISGTDLMTDINALQQAEQDKILHEMEMLQAIYDLKYVTNNK